jgi:hypothetical protein
MAQLARSCGAPSHFAVEMRAHPVTSQTSAVAQPNIKIAYYELALAIIEVDFGNGAGEFARTVWKPVLK